MSTRTAKTPLYRAVAGLVLLVAAVNVAADDPAKPEPAIADTSRWHCALCPYRYGWYGEFDIGGGSVSDPSLKFGDYRGLEEEGGFLALDGDAHYRDENGRFLDLRMVDLGIDSRRFDLRGGRRGRYVLSLGYREIPKYRGHGAQTPYRGAGGGQLSLPADWVAAPLTSGMGRLAQSLQPAELKISRRVLDGAWRWRLGPRWSWEVDYQHQSKEGTRPFGAGVFTINSSHFPAPVDFSTDRLDLGLAYAGDAANFRLGLSGSEFDNHIDTVTWPNPFTPVPGTEVLRASLEPDNAFYQFSLTGAWAPSPKLRFSGHAAIGRMEQDDPLLPASINPNFSDVPLPRMTADTRIDADALNVAGRLSAELSRRLDLTLRLRRDERDNQTPVDIWRPVITDFIARDPRPNRPYSFERDRAEIALRYRAKSALRLQAGADFEDYERSLQSAMETEESAWWGEISLSPGATLELRARIERSDRDADPYVPVEDFSLIEHPLMRKFNLADRDRDRLQVDLDWFPHPDLTVNLNYQSSEDDYENSIIGLHDSEEQTISLDVGWSLSERIYAHAFVSVDDIDSTLSGAESETAVPWLAVTEDEFLTAGVGITATLSERTRFGFDYVRSDSDGDVLTVSGAMGGPFPTLQADLSNARLHLDFRANQRWGVKAYLEYEEYDSSDWALDGLGPDGIPAILTFGMVSPDYSVTVVRLQASYRF